MERNIEKLNNQNTNDNKYSEEYYRNEKAFLKGYRHLLNILKGTNNFYLKTIRTIKRIFFVFILIIFFGGIIALLIMLYISKIKYKDYSALVEKEQKNQSKIVKIFNNVFNFNKKYK